MNQDQLNKILQIIGELTVNLRFANEEIARLNQRIEELEKNDERTEDNVDEN